MNKDPKELMEQGWKDRENLEFEAAEKNLQVALDLFKNAEDWYNVTECLNHLAYTQKLKAQQELIKGIQLSKESNEISQDKGTKKGSVLRALMSIYCEAGNFEKALQVAHKLSAMTEKPANRADVWAHIAKCELRTGNAKKALETIKMAEAYLAEGWESEREPHRSIWKCSLLLNKALILFNLGEKESALDALTEALKISQDHNLKSRSAQALEIKELIESSN